TAGRRRRRQRRRRRHQSTRGRRQRQHNQRQRGPGRGRSEEIQQPGWLGQPRSQRTSQGKKPLERNVPGALSKAERRVFQEAGEPPGQIGISHMRFAATVLLATALAAPQVEVSTLNGEQHSGQLVALTAEAATLAGKEGEQSLPVANLLELRFPATKVDDLS